MIFLLLISGLLLVLTGCDEDPALPTNLEEGTSGVSRGTISETYDDFTLKFDTADGPAGFLQGPFFMHGANLRYDDGAGALLVDFTITNAGIVPQPEPVEITFLYFIPETVSVLNAPGQDGAFTFGFANDDGVWTPGEESLPLTVMFEVPSGVSIGFGAHISLGYGSTSGVICGRVWSDQDQDGVMDDWERGYPGVQVFLEGDPIYSVDKEIETWLAVTGPDGKFAFGGLLPGHYVVGIEPLAGRITTTPTSWQILLVEDDGGVSSFTDANFGMLMLVSPFITIPAGADAMIRADLSSRMNDNHGADPFLGVGGKRTFDSAIPPDAIRSLIHFPMVNSMYMGLVAEARLELTIVGFWEGVDQSYQLEVYPVVPSGERTPWVEGNGSEIQPLPPGVAWVDPAYGVAWIGAADGGDLNNQTRPDIAEIPVARAEVIQGVHGPGSVISWDVTDLVNDWITGEIPNLGIMLRDGNTPIGFRQLMFGARDGVLRGYTDPRVQEGPRLHLKYAEVDEE